MLIVLPSTPAAQQASALLTSLDIPHQLIPIPESLGYQNVAELALYADGPQAADLATLLTRHRFVVMRVFKEFTLPQ